MKKMCVCVFLLVFSMGTNLFSAERRENTPPPPGTVISASIDWEDQKECLSAPTIEIMPDGTYVMTHDCFKLSPTSVFESKDKGVSWNQIASFQDHNSGTLFRIGTTLYYIGYYHPEESSSWIAIRKSEDGGRTWSDPNKDPKSGLLLADKSNRDVMYYTDSVPVLLHNGRVWWQVDVVRGGNENWIFGTGNNAILIISAPIDSDLLDANNWTCSNIVESRTKNDAWGWIEGNVLPDPDGNMFVYLRMEKPDELTHCIARLHLSKDGKELSFDKEKDLLPFPSRRAKFNIRYDDVSKKYWSLTSFGTNGPRNRLLLVCSDNLIDWKVRATIHLDEKAPQSGFQYCDWRADGDDMVYVMRLGWYGRNFHDSNYITFDRIKDFRNRKD